MEHDGVDLLSYNQGALFLADEFKPEKLCMLLESGRVYHPSSRVGLVAGLITDKLTLQWTKDGRFEFGNGEDSPPTKFRWKDQDYILTNELAKRLK